MAFDADGIRRDHPLSEYLPARGIALKADGREWRCSCPLPGHSGDNTPSFTVRPGRKNTQEFHCFGCGEHGDVIAFVQAYDGVEFKEACEILGGKRQPPTSRPAQAPAAPPVDIYADWKTKVPPASVPPILPGVRTPRLENPKRGKSTSYVPAAVYPYRLADGRVFGYVLRVEIDGGKITPLILYCQNAKTGAFAWCHRPLASPRRLYNLPAFAARPDAPVLVVEGEKCAEAAALAMPSHVATCWQGGGKAAGKSDWSPVSGRDVLIWPDADPEGLAAAQEAGRLASEAGARSVSIVEPPDDAVKGWDIADAVDEGRDVEAFARSRAQLLRNPEANNAAPATPATGERRFDGPPDERDRERSGLTRPALRPVAQEKPQSDPEHKPEPKPRPPLAVVGGTEVGDKPRRHDGDAWKRHLELDQNNNPVKKIMKNVISFLQYHPDMEGCIARNVFSNEIMLLRRPPWEEKGAEWTPRPMADPDFVSAVAWLDGPRMNTNRGTVTDAVLQIAHANRFDPVRDYLNGLKWDGVERLHTGPDGQCWLSRYLGVKPTKNEVERAFSLRWLIAAVARQLTDNPAGAKVDNMLVVEGRQGLMKSTALETLATLDGNRWFTSGVNDVRSKDGLLQMQGCLIVEMDELAALGKSDVEKVKSFISTQQDDIRPPYGRRIEKMPRRFVLAGTMNPRGMGYLPDSTGNRRFWPVFADRPADIEALRRDRDQLWAEAVSHYFAGEPWWLQGDEVQHAEAEQRKRFQADPWADDLDAWLSGLLGKSDHVTLKEAFHILSIPIHQRNSEVQARIVNHFTQAGWTRGTVVEDGGKKTVFRRPQP